MGQNIYRREILAEFLLRGLICEKRMVQGGERELLRLPEKGEVEKWEIDDISKLTSFPLLTKFLSIRTILQWYLGPLQLATKFHYPPVYQLLGDDDWLCKLKQIYEFKEVLDRQDIDNKAVTVLGQEHGFDTHCSLNDAVDVQYIKPAVEWLDAIVKS
jgi:hypothetical protein